MCAAAGYQVPDWSLHDPEARPGEVVERTIASKALRRQVTYHLYLPARFRRVIRYPLLVVHDGQDYLNYASAKTVLDNLIHRNEIAEMVVAFVRPVGDRLVEYANHAPHARFVARELVPELTAELPLVDSPVGRTLMGSSFGGVASVSTAARYPDVFGSLLLESPSLVFTDIGQEHGGGPVFDPVVKFVNRYRARPRRIVDRIYLTCGMYEPLITPNRSMVTVFREAGHGGEVRRGARRPQLGELARPAPRRARLAASRRAEVRLRVSPSEEESLMAHEPDKAVERWRSDRMKQDITLARWGHYGVPGAGLPDRRR